MCSNYFLEIEKAKLAAFYGIDDPDAIGLGKADVFPGYQGTVLVKDGDAVSQLSAMQWGLLPPWAKTPKHKPQPFNARGETVAKSPMFKEEFKLRRCLVPATGFTEWKADEAGKKHRYRFTLPTGTLFSFAGIWTAWQDEITSYTIITIGPNEFMADFHDRMPVMLPKAEYDLWLDPKTTVVEAEKLLVPFDGELKAELNERTKKTKD